MESGFMSTKHVIKYKLYASDLIPNYKFGTEDDAKEFDSALSTFISNQCAKAEWLQAERLYASLYAVQYAINGLEFHFQLNGSYSERLISACENAIEIWEQEDESDCYTAVMNYIFNAFHPGVQEKLNSVI